MTMITSAYYRERAAESAVSARAATLDNVRQRNLDSEAAWLAMAGRAAEYEASRGLSAARRVEQAGDAPRS